MSCIAEPITPLRHNAGFRLLWTGQLLSNVGSNGAGIAYPLLVLALTHSAVLAGAVGTTSAIVSFVLRLPAGAYADRLDRRLTMLACDAVRTVVVGLLGALVLLHLVAWPLVALVAAADSAGGVLFSPAATAALPAIVPSGQLEAAWAAGEANMYGAGLAGPALGGLLFGLGRAVPFLIDAVSYGVSVGTVSAIKGSFRPERPPERHSLWHETMEGLRFVWHNAVLRALVIQAPLVNFAFTGTIFTVTLALRLRGDPASTVGLAQAGIACGGLAGVNRLPAWRSSWAGPSSVTIPTSGVVGPKRVPGRPRGPPEEAETRLGLSATAISHHGVDGGPTALVSRGAPPPCHCPARRGRRRHPGARRPVRRYPAPTGNHGLVLGCHYGHDGRLRRRHPPQSFGPPGGLAGHAHYDPDGGGCLCHVHGHRYNGAVEEVERLGKQ